MVRTVRVQTNSGALPSAFFIPLSPVISYQCPLRLLKALPSIH